MTAAKEAEPLLPPEVFSDDADVRRLVEAINRLGAQIMSSLDSAIRTRKAPPAAQRERHAARRHLAAAGQCAIAALGYARNQPPQE